MKKRILIIDDSMFVRTIISEAIVASGCEVVGQAGTGKEGIALALELKPDLITLDNILPDMIGLDILKTLKSEEKLASKIIMISAVGQESVTQQGLALGAEDYIRKPFDIDQMLASIKKALG